MREFVSSAGVRCHLRPVSPALLAAATAAVEREYRERGEPIDPPTYTVMLPSGRSETHPHDETTLIVEGDEAATQANQAAYTAHQDAVQRMKRAQSERLLRALLLGGVTVEMPADDTWARQQHEIYGIDVPTEPTERRWHYITTEVLVTPADLQQVVAELMEISTAGMTRPEEVRAAIASFRHSAQDGRVLGAAGAGISNG